MRPAPVLLAVLIAAVGLGLGLRVMLAQPNAQATVVPANGPSEGSSEAPGAAAATPQGHVYTGVAEEPNDVNPFTTRTPVARRLVLAFTHDSLVDTDPRTGRLRPALASAYELSADGTSCDFTLREGVRFADGTPLTMADVLFGWELAEAGSLPFGFVNDAFARVEDVDVLDERHFRIHFRGVYYAALQAVGESWLVGQRQFFVDRVAEQAKLASLPVPAVGTPEFAALMDQIDEQCGPGTGPYALINRPDGERLWRPRQDLLLVRNEYSWRRTAEPGCWNFAGIRILFRDAIGAQTALLRGEIDWYSSPAVDELLVARPELLQSYRRLEYDYNTLGVYRVAWNCARPPCDDVRVRRALAKLFDHDALSRVFGPAARPALAFGKPDRPEYPDLPPLPFDIAAARRELRELGYDPEQGKPLRLVLLAVQGTEPLRRTVDLFVDAAKRAGIDLQVRSRDFGAYLAELQRGEWDGSLAIQSLRAWGDPFSFVHSEAPDNQGHWQNAEADRLSELARATLDDGARTALLRQLHTLVYQEQPVAFLVHPSVVLLLNSHLENAQPGPLGLDIERAYVAPQFQRH